MFLRKFLIGGFALAGISLSCLGATFPVTVNSDSGAGSLRQAILDANSTAGGNTITFNIPGGGVQIIAPFNALPAVTNQVTIDATTQPDYAGAPLVVLSGSSSGFINGLTIAAPGCAIKGLVIGGFGSSTPRSGILLLSASNTVTACYLGVSETGAAIRYNHYAGILISNAPDNIIGGLAMTDRNLIGGNNFGVFITGANASNNVVLGNWFSLSQNGSNTLVNGTDITISNAPNNIIGGTTAAARNVLDGSSQDILVNGGATGNAILGNYLNLLPNGSPAASANGFEEGIRVQNATGTVIGGTMAGARNIISDCDTAVQILDATTSGTVVQGNFLGTDPTGMTGDFNYESVSIQGSSGNLIGGSTVGAGNVMVGRGFGAVAINGANNNVVQGNFIGTDASGMNALRMNNGTQTAGVIISAYSTPATGNLIGGLTAGAPNVIAGLTSDGVYISGTTASNNIVQGNHIGVAADGVTALGNAGNGVDVFGSNSNLTTGNLIGNNGSSGAAGIYLNYSTNNLVFANTVFSNQVTGVTMIAGPNVISQNSIYGNGGLGIGNGGAASETSNIPGQHHHFPILTSAISDGMTTSVSGILTNDTPNTTFIIELFNNPAADPSGFGQGRTFLGSTSILTDGIGNATFAATFAFASPAGSVVSATSTGPGSPIETSVFGQWLIVTVTTNPSPPISVSIPPYQGITVSQLSFPEGSNSMIGRFEIDINALILWSGLTNGFVNISDASNNWVGMNIPIFDGSFSDITNISTWFPLLNGIDGDLISNVDLHAEYSSAPVTNFPPTNSVITNFPVQRAMINIGGVGSNNVTGFPRLVTTSSVSNLLSGHGVSNIVIQVGHPNVEAAQNQCAPAAVANSLAWLRTYHGLQIPSTLEHVPGITTNIPGVITNNTPSTTNSLVGELEKAMGRTVTNRLSGDGVWPLEGKLKFISQLGLTNSIRIEHAGMSNSPVGTQTYTGQAGKSGTPLDGGQNYSIYGTTSYGTSTNVTWEWIRDQLQKGKDVELCYAWTNAQGAICSHYVEVIGVATIEGLNVILHVSDQDQSSDTNGTGSVQMDIMTSNRLSSAGLTRYAVQAIAEQVLPTNMVVNSITANPTNLVISGRNGVPNGQYVVLTTSNLNLPMLQWMPIQTNYVRTNGQFQFDQTWDRTNYGSRYYRIEVPF